jgi:hypothetical protein
MRLTSPRFSAFCLIAAVVFLPLVAPAQPPQKKTTINATSAAAGQKIFIDPQTRQIVSPSQSQVQALDKATVVKGTASFMPSSPMDITSIYGVPGVLLDESTMSYATATKGADGKMSFSCVDSKQKAEATVQKSTPEKEKLDDK